MSKIKVNEIENRTGSTLTLGKSGTTIQMACGATQTGFGRTGTVDWCTTAKTAPFTAVSGDGFFVNTSGGAVTVTLPSSPSAGDIVAFKDYANSWDSNAVTLCRNGSKINGQCSNTDLVVDSQSVTLIYVDGTKGWQDIHDSTSNVTGTPSFIVATGGTITESGNDKIHTFNSDGTFTIQTAPTPANNNISYMVIAGGGGGGKSRAAGGGAGGFREGKTPATPYTASPLNAPAGLPVSIQAYPVTVGGGGAGSTSSSAIGSSGVNTTFSSITSAGGGGGGSNAPAPGGGANGGSGGGGMNPSPGGGGGQPGGTGNTPPVSPPQGNPGGTGDYGVPHYGAGAGGGATAAGGNGTTSIGGTGGAGATTNISGSPVGRAGGGGGGGNSGTSGPASDGGGAGGSPAVTTGNGTSNTGGGGGGGNGTAPNPANATDDGGNGGSGVVIIRYKFQ